MKETQPYEVMLSLVILYLAEALEWFDDDTLRATCRTKAGTSKTCQVDTDHLTRLEQSKLIKMYGTDDPTMAGKVLLTGKGRRAAAETVSYYQLELN